MAKDKIVHVDNTGFNATYYENHSLNDFVNENLAGVADSVGDEKAKRDWLTSAYDKVVGKAEQKKCRTKK